MGHLTGFCPANAILNINSHAARKQRLTIHMNLPGNADCSYVNTQQK